MIRFVYLFNYSQDLSLSQGETWYLEEHVPQINQLPDLLSHRSWRYFDASIPFPSAGAPTPFNQFVRRTELCFENAEKGIETVINAQALWEASTTGSPGFRELECMFVQVEPQYDLLKDAPPEQYKYMTMPLHWPKGKPKVDESAEIFINSYCFFYNQEISLADCEDWYIGHHNREGKQLPGIRHYKTWKTIPIPEIPGSPLRPNKWYRLTELGMSPEAYRATMIDNSTRIRFQPSPHGKVIGGWINISINLNQAEDLLRL